MAEEATHIVVMAERRDEINVVCATEVIDSIKLLEAVGDAFGDDEGKKMARRTPK